MTREELIRLGNQIIAADGSEEDLDELIARFDANVPYPSGSSLFFWPENHSARTDAIAEYNPAVEDVVDKCLAYKPPLL
jgi:hypothetical protein